MADLVAEEKRQNRLLLLIAMLLAGLLAWQIFQ